MNIRSAGEAVSKPIGKKRSTGTELMIDWYPQELPVGTGIRNVPLRTSDGASVSGILYAVGKPHCVVCLMHPREYFGFHYLVPALLKAGVAVWTQGARSIGNDLRLEHEQAVLDAAIGIDFLRTLDFQKIVLVGNSGGSGLYSYYIQQSKLSPSERLAKGPTGKSTGFESASMPTVDGIVYVAPHPGQGRLLMGCIDPSVIEEGDALSADSSLDPFSSANGYRLESGASRYSLEFVQRYRHAQRERVVRLDDTARRLIQGRQTARKRIKDNAEGQGDRLRAAHTPIMTIWRTDADLRCLDQTLDPSDRAPGSIWGTDMLISNYGAVGFGRLCTPESWLSTWSGISSVAALEKTGPSVTVPALVIEYTGDQTTFPDGIREILGWIASEDKEHIRVHGDHHGRALDPSEEPGRLIAGREIGSWLRRHAFA
jgi:pimeloyl-ACP methyl ester carboxylesterase